MKLGTRLALIAAGTVAVVVLAVSVGAYFVTRSQLLGEVDDSLRRRAAEVTSRPGVVDLLRAFDARGPFRGRGPSAEFDDIFIQLVGPDGGSAVPPNQEITLPIEPIDIEVARVAGETTIRTVEVDGVMLRMITAPLGSQGAVQMARPLTEIEAALAGLRRMLSIMSAGAVAAAGAIAGLAARRALRPLDDLTDTAERVAVTRELSTRIDVDRGDEVGRLAAAFNAMLAALEAAEEQQRRLVRDAGHELKTPLTALRTNIELLARADRMAPGDRGKLLEDATRELEELSELVTEVVAVAADAKWAEEDVADVRLDEVARRVAKRFEARIGRPIELDLEPVVVEGRPMALERAIGNLIDNAAKFGPDEPITLRVAGGEVTVRDRGAGIAAEDRPRVFDRFYRSPAARSRPGSGLGLAIVKAVADAHGGDVFVRDPEEGPGVVVGFRIPGARPVAVAKVDQEVTEAAVDAP